MIRRLRFSSLANAGCLALLSFLSVPLFAQNENGAIAGQITIARGNFPPDRIQVTLQTRGIVVNEAWTDDEGNFVFHELPPNLYHVVISDLRYEPYQEEVKFDPHKTTVTMLNIRLTPKAVAKGTASPTIAGANPYLIDPADYEKRFPKKVVQEFKAGTRSQANGNADEAVRHFLAALKLAPDFYPAHNNLGAIYLAQSRFPAAQGEFEAALRLKASDAQAYFNLGNVFLLTKRYQDAEHNIRQGLQKQPSSAFGNFLLGSLYQETGETVESERCLRRSLELDPGMTKAHLALVNLYLREGRKPDAVVQLKLFLQAAPNDPITPKVQQTLRKLQAELPAARQ